VGDADGAGDRVSRRLRLGLLRDQHRGWTDLGRVGVLVGFGVLTWRVAIFAMTRKLID
jgi:hypothetical protein